jgi:hypothetical protein
MQISSFFKAMALLLSKLLTLKLYYKLYLVKLVYNLIPIYLHIFLLFHTDSCLAQAFIKYTQHVGL